MDWFKVLKGKRRDLQKVPIAGSPIRDTHGHDKAKGRGTKRQVERREILSRELEGMEAPDIGLENPERDAEDREIRLENKMNHKQLIAFGILEEYMEVPNGTADQVDEFVLREVKRLSPEVIDALINLYNAANEKQVE